VIKDSKFLEQFQGQDDIKQLILSNIFFNLMGDQQKQCFQ